MEKKAPEKWFSTNLLFFSFSSTSSLAGERLNKDYYFFFTKHLLFTFIALSTMVIISAIKTNLLIKLVTPLFVISFILLTWLLRPKGS